MGAARRGGQGYSARGKPIPLAKGGQMPVGGAGIAYCNGALRVPVPV